MYKSIVTASKGKAPYTKTYTGEFEFASTLEDMVILEGSTENAIAFYNKFKKIRYQDKLRLEAPSTDMQPHIVAQRLLDTGMTPDQVHEAFPEWEGYEAAKATILRKKK